MNCPTCPESTLVVCERGGVEIDYCPRCRGMWLDRGELDKIVERLQRESGGDGRHAPVPRREDDDDDERYESRRRKKPFWMELFD